MSGGEGRGRAPVPSRGRALAPLLALLLGAGGCGAWSASGPGCGLLGTARPLPEVVDESSGIAVSRGRPGILWTHNDSDGLPVLYAVDSTGTLVQEVRVRGARNRDWEDLALGPCPDGGPDGGDCLYVADTGDNRERREELRLIRVPEPVAGEEETAPASVFRFRLPDGPRDVEAIFLLPGERLHLVSKGRNHPVSVYRYPGALDTARTPVLEEVQRLSEGPRALPRMVTGAGADPSGGVVAVRTYESLRFFRHRGGRLDPLESGEVALRTLDEAQGEAVAVSPGGIVHLTSESGPVGLDRRGSFLRLRCEALGATLASEQASSHNGPTPAPHERR